MNYFLLNNIKKRNFKKNPKMPKRPEIRTFLEKLENSRLYYILMAVFTLLIFAVDLTLPKGRIIWALYILPITAISWKLKKSSYTYLLSLFYILLIVASLLLDPAGPVPFEILLFNRILGIFVLISVTYYLVKRKEAAEMLIERENQLNNAIKYNPLPLMVRAEDGEVITINNAWTEASGYTIEDIPTIPEWAAKAYRDRQNAMIADISDVFNKIGKVAFGEHTIFSKNGEKRIWDLNAAQFGYLPDTRRAVITMAFDVTERKQIERRLEESIKTYSQTFNNTSVGIAHIDRNGKWLWVNRKLLEMLNFTPEELYARTFLDITHPEDLDKGTETDRRLWNHEIEEGIVEKRYITKDGKVLWVNIAISLADEGSGNEYKIAVIQDVSERKRFEEALKESEERFRKTFEFASAGIAHTLPDGTWLRLNDRYCELLGYTRSELENLSYLDVTYPEDLEKELENKRKLLSGEIRYFSMEKRYIRKNGSIQWVLLNCSLASEYSNNLIYFVSVVEDLTHHKKIEQELQIRRIRAEQLSSISKALSDVELDFQTVIETAVKCVHEFTGDPAGIRLISDDGAFIPYSSVYDSDEDIMAVLYEMASGIEQFSNEGLSGQAVRTGSSILISDMDRSAETIFIKQEFRPFIEKLGAGSILIVPLIVDVQVLGVLVVIRNHSRQSLTKDDKAFLEEIAGRIAQRIINARLYKEKLREIEIRKRTEEMLIESERRFRTLTEFLPQIVWTSAPDGSVDYYNGRWSQYSGVPAEEAYGWNWGFLLHPEDKEPTLKAWHHAIETGEPFEIAHRLKRYDGEFRWHISRGVSLKNIRGKIIKWFCTATDINEEKAAQERLGLTLKELERSNNELEQFAYIASHDLQEPIRMIRSYSQLLEKRYKEKLDKKAEDYLGFIDEGGTRMHLLVSDLLQYSRITTKARPFEAVDCSLVVDNVLADLKIKIAEEKARVDSKELPVVKGDRTQIRQLFQNLIQNAIKFKSTRRPEIQIGAGRKGNYWQFHVSDNGIGIEKEFFERIFVIFQRLHEREKYPGTGIGLAICKKIVERHSGQIWVESEPGNGTTFYFTLPV